MKNTFGLMMVLLSLALFAEAEVTVTKRVDVSTGPRSQRKHGRQQVRDRKKKTGYASAATALALFCFSLLLVSACTMADPRYVELGHARCGAANSEPGYNTFSNDLRYAGIPEGETYPRALRGTTLPLNEEPPDEFSDESSLLNYLFDNDGEQSGTKEDYCYLAVLTKADIASPGRIAMGLYLDHGRTSRNSRPYAVSGFLYGDRGTV